MLCVDLGASFPTHTFLQNLASIQPITSLVKFARSPRTDPPGGVITPTDVLGTTIFNAGYGAEDLLDSLCCKGIVWEVRCACGKTMCTGDSTRCTQGRKTLMRREVEHAFMKKGHMRTVLSGDRRALTNILLSSEPDLKNYSVPQDEFLAAEGPL